MSEFSRKIYIPNCLTLDDLRGFTELFLLVPYFNERVYSTLVDRHGYWNSNLYDSLWLNPSYHTPVNNIEDCDYVIAPFKYDSERVQDICNEAARKNKTVIAFYNDDNAGPFQLRSNLILYRTSALKSQLSKQERILPVLVPDHKPNTLDVLSQHVPQNHTIGFCGQTECGREELLRLFENSDVETNFIRRHGFWAPEMSKLTARREFYKHLAECGATLCMRGGGNFSYRLYEALSFGRIPIIIDNDMQLPMEKLVPWDVVGPIIKHEDLISNPVDVIKSIDLNQYSPGTNRLIWEKYFSPEGFIKHLFVDIES